VPGWPAYPAGVAWALGLAGPGAAARTGGMSLHIDSSVPTGSGLSSSAALECAVALALRDLHRLGASRAELALACQRAENEVVGAPTGIMDQFASLSGEHGSAVFIDWSPRSGRRTRPRRSPPPLPAPGSPRPG
jgi:galactokinase